MDTNSFQDTMKNFGYVVGQPWIVVKSRVGDGFHSSEKKIIKKIEAINDQIRQRECRIMELRKEIDTLTTQKKELRDLCPHPSVSIRYGPQKKKRKAEIEEASCSLCGMDLTEEEKKKNSF